MTFFREVGLLPYEVLFVNKNLIMVLIDLKWYYLNLIY